MLIRTRSVLIVGAVLFANTACSPVKLYEGPAKDDTEVSHYAPGNYAGNGLTTPYQIYSARLDAHSFGNDAGLASQELIDSLLRSIQMTVGTHEVEVSVLYLTADAISTGTGVVIAPGNRAKFPGIYHFRFESRPGHFYAPIFNLKNSESNWFEEVCIAEDVYSGLKKSLSATRSPTARYIACAKPTLRNDPEIGKLCSSWLAGSLPMPDQLKKQCESVDK